MKLTLKTFGLLLFLSASQIAFGQINKEKAKEKEELGLKFEEEDRYYEAIKVFEEAQKLDPDNIEYPYEIAYCYMQLKDYDQAISVAEKLLDHKDAEDVNYQLLGNAYDDFGRKKKAVEIYEAGLKKFPNSGSLYLERGNIEMGNKNYSKALEYFEKGIEVAPKFPSNYYWATKIYCTSSEEVWGMIYGEIFMNLERRSLRTPVISKLLYDTYKSEIKFSSDTSFSVSFSQNSTMSADALSDPSKMKIPFGTGAYEPTLMMSMLNEKAIDLNSLDRIRKNFVETYFKNETDKKYPNILFDYQNEILAAGHLEAYDHWLLMRGDEEGFAKWKDANRNKWNDFVKWFSENKMTIDETHRFYSAQY